VKKYAKLTASMVILFMALTFAPSAQAAPSPGVRLGGSDRFATSVAIANEEIQGNRGQNVVLASGYNFPDALAASTLAAKLKAPIILVGSGVYESQDVLDYTWTNALASGGVATIVGGRGVINSQIRQFFQNVDDKVNRLGGIDRYATDMDIVNSLDCAKGTPVVIASGENYPDALGIAPVAASKGWPVLLSGPDQLPDAAKAFLVSDQPSSVYLIGGEGVLHDSIQTDVQTASPNAQVQRLGGQDRFDTLAQVLRQFYPNPTSIYLANGYDFADALSGSTLAAEQNAPIVLINPSTNGIPQSIFNYLGTLQGKGVQVNVLGGTGAVPDGIVQLVNERLGNVTAPAPNPVPIPLPNQNPTPSPNPVSGTPTIENIAPIFLTTTVGVPPVLPSKIPVNMSNGSTKDMSVTWTIWENNVYNGQEDTSPLIMKGIIDNTTEPAFAIITVLPKMPTRILRTDTSVTIRSVAPIIVTTHVGVKPVLPTTVAATMGDGTVEDLPVWWPIDFAPQKPGVMMPYGSIQYSVIEIVAFVNVLP